MYKYVYNFTMIIKSVHMTVIAGWDVQILQLYNS